MTTHDEMDDAVDLALRARLAKLAAVPVDTSRLEKAIKAQLPPQASVLLAVYNWLWLVPLSLTLLAWFKWPHRNRRALAAAACGIASSAVVVGVAYWAAFQPKLILAAISAASNAP